MSDAATSFQEARERSEGRGERWVPVAAAVLAVLSAVSGFLSNVRSTAALVAKNDAIVSTAHASDTYAQYEAERQKFYAYQSLIDAGIARNIAKVRATTTREAKKGPPLLAKARTFDDESHRQNERSESLLASHERIEVAATLFEVAIVLDLDLRAGRLPASADHGRRRDRDRSRRVRRRPGDVSRAARPLAVLLAVFAPVVAAAGGPLRRRRPRRCRRR